MQGSPAFGRKVILANRACLYFGSILEPYFVRDAHANETAVGSGGHTHEVRAAT